jgi:hypothetical protein
MEENVNTLLAFCWRELGWCSAMVRAREGVGGGKPYGGQVVGSERVRVIELVPVEEQNLIGRLHSRQARQLSFHRRHAAEKPSRRRHTHTHTHTKTASVTQRKTSTGQGGGMEGGGTWSWESCRHRRLLLCRLCTTHGPRVSFKRPKKWRKRIRQIILKKYI